MKDTKKMVIIPYEKYMRLQNNSQNNIGDVHDENEMGFIPDSAQEPLQHDEKNEIMEGSGDVKDDGAKTESEADSNQGHRNKTKMGTNDIITSQDPRQKDDNPDTESNNALRKAPPPGIPKKRRKEKVTKKRKWMRY